MFGTHASERHAARLVVIVTFLLFGAPERLVVHPVHGESAPIPEDTAPVGVDSGSLSSPIAGGAPGVIFSDVVAVPAAPWVRLRFGSVTLAGSASSADESFLRITSLEDGAVQVLNSEALVRWGNSSAYFNGDRVVVELVAYAGTGDNRVVIDSATFGLAGGGEEVVASICGPTDDRVSSNDPRIGRILPTGCTGFQIDRSPNCLLTAGHCFSVASPSPECIQFNVPCSKEDGTLNHPSPEHQYPLDPTSFQFEIGGSGNDWAYFGVFDNTTTGLSPLAAQGTPFTLATTVPPADFTDVTLSGYGIDFDPAGPVAPLFRNEKSLTQQTDTGAYEDKIGTLLRYFVDTTGGSSGSPVEYLASGEVIGIHTHGGCEVVPPFANQGTAIDHPNLQSALGNPLGVCAEIPDCNENGVPDDQDIAGPTSNDNNANGLPDECEPDCNGNGVSDHIDIASGTSTDTNLNRIADDCEAKVFVDAGAIGTGNGTSWEDAYTNLQAALQHVTVGDPCGVGSPVMASQFWLAEGVYTPAFCPGGCSPTSPERADSFVVPAGGSMYGGFPSGGGDGTFGARNPGQYITALSGDLNADDAVGGDNSENSYHVVNQFDVFPGIVLDGFMITAGNANGPQLVDQTGGGILMHDGLLANCVIRGNSADNIGGGVHAGGPTVVNCLISDNSALAGAGMSMGEGDAIVANCTISGNTASFLTGGLYTSATFGSPTISNSIFWGNTDPGGQTETAQILISSSFGNSSVTFNNIQDCNNGLDGLCEDPDHKNITQDPLFVGPNDFRLLFNSPCIDRADSDALPPDVADLDQDGDVLEAVPGDLGFLPRSIDDPNTPNSGVIGENCGFVDMGAHEFQASCVDGNGNFICDQVEFAQTPLIEDSLGVFCVLDIECQNDARCLPVGGPGKCYVAKNRYISIDPNPISGVTAMRVKLDATPNAVTIGWVGQPDVNGLARLSDTPFYDCWDETVHLGDCEIAPENIYLVQAINVGDDIVNENNYSAAISLPTSPLWGDVCGLTVAGAPTPPQGVVNLVDASYIVKTFQADPNLSLPIAWADLGPANATKSIPNGMANLQDAQLAVQAFSGIAYGGSDPLSCAPPSAPGPPVTITLVPREILIQAGDPIEIDAFVDDVSDLAGYQVKLAVSGGTAGELVLTTAEADTAHPDYVFAARTTMEAEHVAGERMGNILIDTGAGVTVTESKYLTTFSYVPSQGATGVFDFTVVTGEESYLTDTTTKKIDVQGASSPVVGVGVDCLNDSHCDDKNDCTNDYCTAYQCIFSFEPSRTICDDGQFCTAGDECNGLGGCVGGPPPCSTKETCCELTDECVSGNCP